MELKLALLAKDMHNSVLPTAYGFFGEKLGIDVSFRLCNTAEEHLGAVVEDMRQTLNGFTVTMPYKVKILDYCDALDDSAMKCGSANTVRNDNGRLIGYNTDGWGMVKCLDLKGFHFKDKTVTMVGAGGVALSIAYNLSIVGVKSVKVLNLFKNETERLVSKMGPLFTGYTLSNENLRTCALGADCFINASILGQVGYDDYEDLGFLDLLQPNAVVFDVNYSNPAARLPQAAREKSLLTYVGKTMSACQGIRAMEIWTGQAPSDEAARELVGLIERGDPLDRFACRTL